MALEASAMRANASAAYVGGRGNEWSADARDPAVHTNSTACQGSGLSGVEPHLGGVATRMNDDGRRIVHCAQGKDGKQKLMTGIGRWMAYGGKSGHE
jgi:hypothetical protein